MAWYSRLGVEALSGETAMSIFTLRNVMIGILVKSRALMDSGSRPYWFANRCTAPLKGESTIVFHALP